MPSCTRSTRGADGETQRRSPADGSAGLPETLIRRSFGLVADLDAADTPAVAVPEALANQTARRRLFHIDRGGCTVGIDRRRAAGGNRSAEQGAADQAAGNSRGNPAAVGP